MMTLNIHGINAGSEEDKPDEAKVKAREKEKEKAEVAEDFSNREDSKAEAKAEEKAALTWWGEEGYEDEWQEEDEWNEYEGFWTEDEDQDWNDAFWGTDELYYKDEYGMFQGKKGKKGKKGKDDEGKGKPGYREGKSNYVQPSTSSNQSIQNQPQQVHYTTSAASSSGHSFVSFFETDTVRVDVLNANFAEQQDPSTSKRCSCTEKQREHEKVPCSCRRS